MDKWQTVLHPFKAKLPNKSLVTVQLTCDRVFSNFQLKDKEYVYLNAAEFGDVDIVAEMASDPEVDVNCVDYMGRNALLLALKSENLELIDLLISRLNFFAIEDGLLNAVSMERVMIVKLIVDHPNYIRLNKTFKLLRSGSGNSKRIGRSQFSADITPLMLAAHYNNHEIIQILLDRNHKLEPPHHLLCICGECENQRNVDSLQLEVNRLHTYQALASPAYLSLTTCELMKTAFDLRDELYALAQHEKQFKNEYTQLALQCMTFAVGCLDLCRSSDEVGCLLAGQVIRKGRTFEDPLGTVKMAINLCEKKFVSHPNCQHQVENMFYKELINLRDMSDVSKFFLYVMMLPVWPILYAIYIIYPNIEIYFPQGKTLFEKPKPIKVKDFLQCPVIIFFGHMASYLFFLVLITIATFRLDVKSTDVKDEDWKTKEAIIWRYDFRVDNYVMTKLQFVLIFWIIGQFVMESKQVYIYGSGVYFRNFYNVMDALSTAAYAASYALRFIVDYKLNRTESRFREELSIARELLQNGTLFANHTESNGYFAYRTSLLRQSNSYWLRGCRWWWVADDPETVSDCLFAIANVLSFARVTYMMSASELLGPLQISLGRMFSDITRFLILFCMMAFAFVVGLTNLYWYFAQYFVRLNNRHEDKNNDPHIIVGSGIPAFKSIKDTFYTLYWALFGLTSNNVTYIRGESSYPGHADLTIMENAYIINLVGQLLYALYNAAMIIIFLNMLIAMMSKSFDEIQGYRLEEWKFARASLWLMYVEHESVLPVPFNLLPSHKLLRRIIRKIKENLGFCTRKLRRQRSVIKDVQRNGRFLKRRMAKDIQLSENEDARKMQNNLIRRYLFKLQKQKEEENKSGDLSNFMQQQQQQQEKQNEVIRQGTIKQKDDDHAENPTTRIRKKSHLNILFVPPSVHQGSGSSEQPARVETPSTNNLLTPHLEVTEPKEEIEETPKADPVPLPETVPLPENLAVPTSEPQVVPEPAKQEKSKSPVSSQSTSLCSLVSELKTLEREAEVLQLSFTSSASSSDSEIDSEYV